LSIDSIFFFAAVSSWAKFEKMNIDTWDNEKLKKSAELEGERFILQR